ncbi:MFS general substrate transporter [Serendipita vermifera]|nr:MFS general substrate transporter [Serendipita vermifera]
MSHPSQRIVGHSIRDERCNVQQSKAATSVRSLHENHLEDNSINCKINTPITDQFEMSPTPYIVDETCNIRNSPEIATNVPLPDSTSTIMLQTIRSASTSEVPLGDDPHITANISSLAPVDGGIGAWSYLLAAFFVEVIVWGFPNSFGVFLDAYLRDPTYSTQPHAYFLLPLIGTLTTGIMYFSGPFIYPFFYRFPQSSRLALWVGAVLCWASLFGASYSKKVTTLVLCQGVLYALGGAMIYYPCLLYMSEWFVVRRGLANGVINAGTPLSGLILPLILPSLIETHGTSKILRILAIVFFALLVPLLPFVRGRLPVSKVHAPIPNRDNNSKAWMKQRKFHSLILINTFQGLGYFVPSVWLPTFASAMNLSPSKASLALAMLNGTEVIARLSAGILSDWMDPWFLAFLTLLGTCIATFILWGVLSHSLAGLITFGLVYGSLAGGWTSMWTGFVRQIVHEDPMLSTNILSYLMLSRGLGNILSTPISTALSSPHPGRHRQERLGFDVGAGRFENVILYAGTCFAAAAIVASIGWSFERTTPRQSRNT